MSVSRHRTEPPTRTGSGSCLPAANFQICLLDTPNRRATSESLNNCIGFAPLAPLPPKAWRMIQNTTQLHLQICEKTGFTEQERAKNSGSFFEDATQVQLSGMPFEFFQLGQIVDKSQPGVTDTLPIFIGGRPPNRRMFLGQPR